MKKFLEEPSEIVEGISVEIPGRISWNNPESIEEKTHGRIQIDMICLFFFFG